MVEEYNYYPYGLQFDYTQAISAIENRLQFNGKEIQHNEFGTNNGLEVYDFGARLYEPQLGRWTRVDPLAHLRVEWTPYNAMRCNPIMNVDPTGALDHEYEKNGVTGESKKVSDLGGDAVDFTHYKGGEHDGQTEITNAQTCETQWMKSSKNIQDYTRRDAKTNWATLYNEYKNGTGPEKSLMYQNQPMNLELIKSPNFTEALNDYKESGKTKFGTAPFFNPVSAGTNMTAQFVGKANYNFYQVGSKTVIIVIDSKSISSESLNPFNKGEERNIPRVNGVGSPNSTTHQTYLFIVPTSTTK